MALRKSGKKSSNTPSRIGKARPAAMIEEATVDAYGESEPPSSGAYLEPDTSCVTWPGHSLCCQH